MKRSIYILLLIIIAVLAALLVLRGPVEEEAQLPADPRQPALAPAERTLATVWYLTEEGGFLLPLQMRIHATDEVAQVALEQLLAGPATAGLQPSIPPGVRLNGIYKIYQTVYVDLTGEFLAVEPEHTQQALDAITATVLPLVSECRNLQLLIDGDGCDEINGVPTGEPLTMPLINLEQDDLPQDITAADCRAVVYYLPDESLQYLVPHTMLCPPEDGTLPGDAAVLRQAAGRILPECLSVAALSVEGGLAHLDLAYDQTVAYRSGAASEQAWLDALVATACQLEQIDALQITLDGAAAATLPKGTPISGQLQPPETINYLP